MLHLGFEDPRKPGAGGGAVRTHEINSRLADRYDITVVSARFPGCTPYEAEGVRYTHAGAADTYLLAVPSYFLAQPWTVRKHRPDLVVEDFGAPISTWGLPRATSRPVVGVVQWLFAEEKGRQYHLPLAGIERSGVRAHRRLVAVSDDLGDRLRTLSPGAQVDVVPNGLPPAAFTTPQTGARRHVKYLGRLEDAQKGLGLLLEAWARATTSGAVPPGVELHLGGIGPDGRRLQDRAAALGVTGSVRFVGAIAHEERFAWLADAAFVAMPSRYETFGMVAAESLAVGTPVVAFDIDCLRTLVTDGTGRRVPAFDVPAFAAALGELATDRPLRERLGAQGVRHVQHLTWDNAAAAQAAVYDEVLGR